jgi:hypothetical protein
MKWYPSSTSSGRVTTAVEAEDWPAGNQEKKVAKIQYNLDGPDNLRDKELR